MAYIQILGMNLGVVSRSLKYKLVMKCVSLENGMIDKIMKTIYNLMLSVLKLVSSGLISPIMSN